jgi:peptidylprolyl isomerase
VRSRTSLTALAAAAALALAGCGDDSTTPAAAPTQTESAVPSETAALFCAPTTEESAVPAEVPTVDVPAGPPPAELQVTEITEGTGEVAETGDRVCVDYVGVLYEQPDQPFDQSYTRGQPIEFQVGGGVIEGFSQGVTGMKVGGRRQVVIPPEMGYGAQGVGPIPPNSTLVFLMDLREVEKAG